MDVQETEVQTDRILTIPNLLSFVRLLGVPLFLWLILGPGGGRLGVRACSWSAGSPTGLDGEIARATGQISRLGQLLDPLADRLYIAATLRRASRSARSSRGGSSSCSSPATSCSRSSWRCSSGEGITGLPVHFLGKAATFCLLYGFPLLLLGDDATGTGLLAGRRWPGSSAGRSRSGARRSTGGPGCSTSSRPGASCAPLLAEGAQAALQRLARASVRSRRRARARDPRGRRSHGWPDPREPPLHPRARVGRHDLGGRRPLRHHRPRAGRARRHRLRDPARRRRGPRRGPALRRGRVDEERLGHLRTGDRHGSSRATTPSRPARRRSTPTRTATAGWSRSRSAGTPSTSLLDAAAYRAVIEG